MTDGDRGGAMTDAPTMLDSGPHRDSADGGAAGARRAVLGALALVVALAWVSLAAMASHMYGMTAADALCSPSAWGRALLCSSGLGGLFADPLACGTGLTVAWSWSHAVMALGMWVTMAVAMMVPTAWPAIAAYGDIAAAARAKGDAGASAVPFVSGYVAAWSGFAVVAVAAQWGLDRVLALDAAGALTPVWGAAVLIGAGLYQFSAVKAACLTQCRSPMTFFFRFWRPGRRGAFEMGAHHGLFCIGCCWALMLLMFVGGTMNLVWMALLTLVMAAEKSAAGGEQVSRAVALVCLVGGAALLAAHWVG
jgi:predicted metal-binding membrane protein